MNKVQKSSIFILLLCSGIILWSSSSCNKNKDDDTMKDIISYTGKTDQDETIQIQTGTINGNLYLKSYSFTVTYHEGGSEASYTASQDNTDGIMQINNNTFEVNIDQPGDFLKGNIVAGADSITGTYSYRFVQEDATVSGEFWSAR